MTELEKKDPKIPALNFRDYESLKAMLDDVLAYCQSSVSHRDNTQTEDILLQKIPEIDALLADFMKIEIAKGPQPGDSHVPNPILWKTIKGLYISEIRVALKDLQASGDIFQTAPGFYKIVPSKSDDYV